MHRHLYVSTAAMIVMPHSSHIRMYKYIVMNITDWLISKLLLALASTVILGSDSHGTHDHILLPDGSGSLQNPVGM
jgi:hypothetical protein